MLARKRILLLKAESTYGTDSTPAATDAMLTKNLQINVQQGNRVQRNLDRITLGNDEEIATSRYTTISGVIELAGAGAAGTAAPFAALLRACGWSETLNASTSAVYELISDNFESATAVFVIGDEEHRLLGCRGTLSVSLNADSLPEINFTLTGLHVDAVAASALTPNTTAFQVPVPVTDTNTTTYTVDSYAVKAESFSFDQSNEVVYRNVVNSENVTIVDRSPTGSLSFEAPAIGTKDFHDIAKDGTLVAIAITHGTVAGNIIEFSAPNVQLSNLSHAESAGILMLNMNTRFIPGSSGDDEFVITIR